MNNGLFQNNRGLHQFFRISHFDSSRSIGIETVERVMKSSFYLHIQSHLSRLTGFSVHWAHASLCYAGLSILEARERLNAICLNRTSMAFLSILGNLARYALLYKWLNPKYCSTSAPRGCTRDEDRFLEVGFQEQASNHLKLQW